MAFAKRRRNQRSSRKCCYDTVYDTIPELFRKVLADGGKKLDTNFLFYVALRLRLRNVTFYAPPELFRRAEFDIEMENVLM